MEEKKKYEELKSILEGLQKALELYNDLNPQEKLAITPQDERKDVSEIYICVYNDKHIGLFREINWKSGYCDLLGREHCYYAGSVYIGVDSDYIGMKDTHEFDKPISKWRRAGCRVDLQSGTYVANCDMKNCMSFDDMRLIMYCNGEIEIYEIGKASCQEILDVLKYARSYYQIVQNIQNEQNMQNEQNIQKKSGKKKLSLTEIRKKFYN